MKRKEHENEMESDGFTLVVAQQSKKKKFQKEKKEFGTSFHYKTKFEVKQKNKKPLTEIIEKKK